MMELTHRTPEEAALEGFPARACRVLATVREGGEAYVLIDTGPAGAPRLYGASASRRDGGWIGRTAGDAPGWSLTDAEHDAGTLSAWGEAPAGATRVRVSFDGEVREAPVAHGAYLVAWFGVPCPAGGFPRVDAFQVDGKWIAPGCRG